jgi:uncharacterized protein (DUF58 family)
VKRFVEERELTVQIMVDVSASMRFGTTDETKRALAAQLAAVFAVLAIRNNDRVGLAMFDHEVEAYIPPKKGRKHIMRLITQILDHQPRGGTTDLVAALRYVARVTRRRSIILVVSDFLSDSWETELTLLARRHDVIPVVIEDLRERSFQPQSAVVRPWWERLLGMGGLVALRDLETGAQVLVDPESAATRTWELGQDRRRQERQKAFVRLGLETLYFDTAHHADTDFVRAIAAFFRRRSRRS